MCVRRAWTLKYSGFTEVLPTRAFLVPLDEDEEIEVALGKGQSVSIKYKAVSELQPNGKRCAPPPRGTLGNRGRQKSRSRWARFIPSLHSI